MILERNKSKNSKTKSKTYQIWNVLIWHSNLLHGGSSIKDSKATRRSQVTHYFFRNCAYKRPFLLDALSIESALSPKISDNLPDVDMI